ncbi:MAG: isoaspartyl peptidase/L-asparaginase [Acidobacteriota bacterium]|nr:isoaspartyl peptidase/L-asparaginase [Acidobacteriota bacterium]
MTKIALAIHGGAGTIFRSSMTAELEREYRGGLENALRAGWEILQKAGTSLDAVEATTCVLEDFHLFNAGRGSVFTHHGKNEMDASIMDGKTLNAGAVAFVKNIKNPIKLARLVMEKTEHVLLAGDGANQFAAQMGVETADDQYFFTRHRWQQLEEAIAAGRTILDHSEISTAETPRRGENDAETRPVLSVSSSDIPHSAFRNPHSKGTVGAVACDHFGNLAAATSTGGMTNKKFGRIGDTALIGAGNYADNATCAVSCTGHGEFFMIGVTAYDVAARMKYKGVSLEKAANEGIEYLTEIGGEGGLIAVDPSGKVALPFNSDGMYRGFVTAESEMTIEIYR